VLVAKRDRYARAGKEDKTKIINERVELFGGHRKAALRALPSRPKESDPDPLRPPLKAIWLAALQPCGVRLKACRPDWQLIPARIEPRRRATTRPGTWLRHQIPIRTGWTQERPGAQGAAERPAGAFGVRG
jgi:hypothetical protein